MLKRLACYKISLNTTYPADKFVLFKIAFFAIFKIFIFTESKKTVVYLFHMLSVLGPIY